MITASSIPSATVRFVSFTASLALLFAIAGSALAQESSSSSAPAFIQTVELFGIEELTLAGDNVLNDVIARDDSQLSLSRDPVTGVAALVEGNALSLNTARIFITHTRVAGNVNASDDSIILIEQSSVDGNIEVNGNAIIAIGPQTVVSGDILGVFLGTDADGYAIYVGL